MWSPHIIDGPFINEPVPEKFSKLLQELESKLVPDEIVEAAAAAYDAADTQPDPGPTTHATHKQCMRAALLAVAFDIVRAVDKMRAERAATCG